MTIGAALGSTSPSDGGLTSSAPGSFASPVGLGNGGGRIGFMLSFVTVEPDVVPADDASCCGDTFMVILNADGEVVMTAEVATDDDEQDEDTGEDSRELILVSLELLLSSPVDCFVDDGGGIGLMVSFGTVCGRSAPPIDAAFPAAEPVGDCCCCCNPSFAGIGLIVIFGIELELMFEC